MAKSFLAEAIQPPVPFNSLLTSIKFSCTIPPNGGVIFLQLSCHILENVNERVCKIKFMGCQWRIRTRRAITYLLSSWSLWYVKQKSIQLNAGISIVLHFTMDVGQCLFAPFFFILPSPSLFLTLFFVWNWLKWRWLSAITFPSYKRSKRNIPVYFPLLLLVFLFFLFYLLPLTSYIIHMQVFDYGRLYFTT